MTRIIAGEARGVQLQIPKMGTRPTSDKVREAIFSRLDAHGAIVQARVLDLYAGSGALGWEALSRGAATLDLVDKAPPVVQILQQNQRKLVGIKRSIKIYRQAAKTFLNEAPPSALSAHPRWDLVFIDPPYELANEEVIEVLQLLKSQLDPDAWVVVERSTRSPRPDWNTTDWEDNGEKKYGETIVYYLRPAVVE